mmetsp:Transcript_7458/g.11653  ORF Transcript_7458/g.11653 Transcript_7458/m.11653 type:complete len:179 (-) Transcript_7458:780-1316(-)
MLLIIILLQNVGVINTIILAKKITVFQPFNFAQHSPEVLHCLRSLQVNVEISVAGVIIPATLRWHTSAALGPSIPLPHFFFPGLITFPFFVATPNNVMPGHHWQAPVAYGGAPAGLPQNPMEVLPDATRIQPLLPRVAPRVQLSGKIPGRGPFSASPVEHLFAQVQVLAQDACHALLP